MRKVKQIRGNKMVIDKGVIRYRSRDGFEIVRGISEYDGEGRPMILEAVQNLADNAQAGIVLSQQFNNWFREMAGLPPLPVIDPYAVYNAR